MGEALPAGFAGLSLASKLLQVLAPKGFNKNEYNVVFNMRSNLTILLLGLVATRPVTIDSADMIATSYPGFLADLTGLGAVTLGAQVGTTSYTAASSVQDDSRIEVYNTNMDAKMALVDGEIDAVVADLPTAFALANELRDGVMIGQFPPADEGAEKLGIVLDRGSSLTRCVSWAVDALRGDGTLAKLERRWLAGAGNAPVLSWRSP